MLCVGLEVRCARAPVWVAFGGRCLGVELGCWGEGELSGSLWSGAVEWGYVMLGAFDGSIVEGYHR